jgi:hypothetical protein
MRQNLDSLKTEIQDYVEAEGFAIFHGYSRVMDTQPLVFWDSERYPDYKLFLKAAKAAGTRIVIVNQREFSSDVLDDAIDQLEASELPIEDQRAIERRLKEMRAYEGFTCSIEISFDHEGRVYLFDIQTEWYEELTNILDDLDFLDSGEDEDDEEEDSLGGYFSKN